MLDSIISDGFEQLVAISSSWLDDFEKTRVYSLNPVRLDLSLTHRQRDCVIQATTLKRLELFPSSVVELCKNYSGAEKIETIDDARNFIMRRYLEFKDEFYDGFSFDGSKFSH